MDFHRKSYRLALIFVLLASAMASKTVSKGFTLTITQSPRPTLTWDAPVSNGAVIVGYKVYRGSVVGTYPTTLTLSPIVPQTFVDNTVTPHSTFHYAVTAVGNTGLESVFSNDAVVNTP